MFEQPRQYPRCSHYAVRVNGVPVDVLPTSVASFAAFEMSAPVRVEITLDQHIMSTVIRPKSLGLSAEYAGRNVTFNLGQPGNFWVDILTALKLPPLYLFCYPPETNPPDPADPKVLYYAAGQVYDVGAITLKDGQTLYIEAGAIVRGSVHAVGARRISIRGRGVLDGSLHSANAGQFQRSIFLDGCEDASIEDITMIHPSTWMVVLGACNHVRMNNLHQIGEVVSSDGIDVVGSQHVTITGCFLRNNDDCVAVKSLDLSKGHPGHPPTRFDARRDVRDVVVQHCTFWNDRAGNAMEVGFELCTENVSGIVFRDIDVLAAHGEGAVFSIHNGDRAVVSDVIWEDIRIEHFYDKLVDLRILKSRYSQNSNRGHVRNITFRNIQGIEDMYNSPSLIGGYDGDHRIENVQFENFFLGGKKICNADALHLFMKNAEGVQFT